MKVGWNLGNTLDALPHFTVKMHVGDYETSWGNPKTDKEMIDDIKKAGFNIVRIPVTWTGHIGDAPDYRIDIDWFQRVEAVIDYVLDNNMQAIINLHHEDWYTPTSGNFEAAADKLEKLWTQIAVYFSGYDSQLIFEGLNEPRLIGTEYEWNGGNVDSWDIVNRLNKIFVRAIRNTGGLNKTRKLMIPTYAASCCESAINAFIIPEGEHDNIIVSVHAYIPYDFALNGDGTSEWSSENKKDTYDIDHLIDLLYTRFTSNGIKVIISEFGAVDKNNKNDRTQWVNYFISQASQKNIACIWWDNCSFTGDGELFGLYDRNSKKWVHPEIVQAMMEAVNHQSLAM
ncbi:MAG: glycoside hydrolase family 5 protein [Oscillospiraceae bacterium]|nr:glycoside hydrolase family 5 protein [Oscillospiraceae bacterium]